MMHIVLYKPDIPQNTAAIVRLSACLDLKVHIIEPCGFNLNDERFKRVVMDYIGLSQIFRYDDYNSFLNEHKQSRIVLMTTKATQFYHKFKFLKNDMLLFGRESAGVPERVHNLITNKLRIPMKKGVRSLNIATSVAIILAESLKQTKLI